LREVLHALERLRLDAQFGVERAVALIEHARLVEEAEVGPLHVEADRGHGPLARGKVREHRREQPLDGARLGGEPRDAGDVEMRRLRSEEEVGVQVDRRLDAPGMVNPDGDAGVRALPEITVHPQRHLDIGVVGEEHLAHRHGLKRLLRQLPQGVRGVQPDLGALRRGVRGAPRLTVVPEHVVHRRLEVGVAVALDDDAEDARELALHGVGAIHAHDGSDPDRGAEGSPEVELVRGVGAALGGDDSTEGEGHQGLGTGEWGLGERTREWGLGTEDWSVDGLVAAAVEGCAPTKSQVPSPWSPGG
jgi:hypothetical protein